MKKRLPTLLIALVGLGALLWTSACLPQTFSTDPQTVISHKTAHFQIHSHIKHQTTQSIGTWLESAMDQCEETIGVCQQPPPPLDVFVYASRKHYDRQAVAMQLPRRVTAGFWTPEAGGSLHLLWKRDLGVDPRFTLVHEATHHYIHHTYNYRIPENARTLFPQDLHILVSVPLWLNEGLATYMEGTFESRERPLNRRRLKQLQQLIRKDKLPPLEPLLRRQTNQGMTSAEYAVAWGMVYSFLHHPDRQKATAQGRRFRTFLKRACNGFVSSDQAFDQAFVKAQRPTKDIKNKWRAHVARQSVLQFKSIFLLPGQNLTTWQRQWANTLLQVR